MAIPSEALKIIRIYFQMVSSDVIGTRLQQIWDGLLQAQRDQIKVLIQQLYYRMFTTVSPTTQNPTDVIIQIESILTPAQKTQIFELIKNDIVAVYTDQKVAIDTEIENTDDTTLP